MLGASGNLVGALTGGRGLFVIKLTYLPTYLLTYQSGC